jgi:hypothetical protein
MMVLLLPLRGWAGDVMTVHMALKGPAAALHHAMRAMPPGCPMHAQAHAQTASAGESQELASGGMEQCAACQLCIPLASLRDTRINVHSPAVHAAPPMLGAGFVSAALAQAEKPPRG